MIHRQDREMLGTMLGVDEQSLPAKVEAECAIRTKMLHQVGPSGPLGPLALIAILRGLGQGPQPDAPRPDKTDWRQYPDDGTTRVEARFGGGWQPGVFLGFVQNGTLAVRLDNFADLVECRYDIVRLAPIDMMLGPDGTYRAPEAELPVVMAESEPASIQPPEEVGDGVAQELPSAPVEPSETAPAAPLDPDEPDWATVPAGSEVWIEYQDDYQRGKFLGCDEAGDLRVVLDGVGELTVGRTKVRYTG